MVDIFSDEIYNELKKHDLNSTCLGLGFCSKNFDEIMSKDYYWNYKNEVLLSSQTDCTHCKQIGNDFK